MKIYDITRELLSASVYPGDTVPQLTAKQQGTCTVSDINMCLHNATHIDAPSHYIPDGSSIADLPVELFFGKCTVISVKDDVVSADEVYENTRFACERVLIKGNAVLNEFSATELIDKGVRLIGTECCSIGDDRTHEILLRHNIVIIEGLDLQKVKDGNYFLSASPLKINGADGAPCRAILIADYLFI